MRAIEKATAALAENGLAARELRDEEPERLLAIARKKRARGEDVVEVAEEPAESADERGGEVVDLVALLKQRLGTGRAPAKRGARASGRTRRRASRRARAR